MEEMLNTVIEVEGGGFLHPSRALASETFINSKRSAAERSITAPRGASDAACLRQTGYEHPFAKLLML